MLSWIMSLYSSPSARIRVNGSLSPVFTIFNGTRHGCPLSPLLYVLTMEHLATALRQNPNITGISVGPLHAKMALFADDLLLFVTQPYISLPAILQEFQRFGEVSNFKVNYNKSELLDISLLKTTMMRLSINFPFKTCSSSIRYSGILIPALASQLYSLKFLPIHQKTQMDLASYAFKKLLWFGRINSLKMDSLPCFQYLFQTIPIHLTASYFKKIHRMFSKFVSLS